MGSHALSQAYRAADADRRHGGMVRHGRVVAVDPERGLARVRFSEGDFQSAAAGSGAGNTTTWLPWHTGQAGSMRIWHAPVVGEQVAVIGASGEPSQGLILTGAFSSEFPSPDSDPNKTHVAFDDGTRMVYDRAAHKLEVTLPSGGTAEVNTPGGTELNAEGGVDVNTTDPINLKASAGEILAEAPAGGVRIEGGAGGVRANAMAVNVTAPAITLNGVVTVNGLLIVTGGIMLGAGQGVTIPQGDLRILQGQVQIDEGDIKVLAGDIRAEDVSLTDHPHPNVMRGGDDSDPPTPTPI